MSWRKVGQSLWQAGPYRYRLAHVMHPAVCCRRYTAALPQEPHRLPGCLSHEVISITWMTPASSEGHLRICYQGVVEAEAGRCAGGAAGRAAAPVRARAEDLGPVSFAIQGKHGQGCSGAAAAAGGARCRDHRWGACNGSLTSSQHDLFSYKHRCSSVL